MNVRKKNAKEKEYDQLQIGQARRELAESAVNFFHEYTECDDVWNKTRIEFRDKVWEYEREKEYSEMPKVGDLWDWENNVCGAYRYSDI